MPFSGAGVYTPPAADFPVVTQTVISSTHFNNTINDIATALSTCLTKDGQQVATANINFGGFRATNVGITGIAGSVGTPAINVSDTGTGLYRSAASELAVTVAGTQRARFDGTGLIVTGVGTFSGATSTTTLTASTRVVTPLMGTGTDARFDLQIGGSSRWAIFPSADNYDLYPSNGDNVQSIGRAANRIKAVFTPIIDSGTTGSLSLRTNNGQTQVSIRDLAGNASNQVVLAGGISTLTVLVGADGTDTIIGMRFGSKGAGGMEFFTSMTITSGALAAGSKQFDVLHTAAANRNITVTGSNGGNPTISTTAGSLAITPNVVIAGTTLQIGTNPSATGAICLPYSSGSSSAISPRNAPNSADLLLIHTITLNGIAALVGIATSASNAGMYAKARSGGAAPTTSDLQAGNWTVWRDTGGATTKLYYNNAGA